MYAKRLPIQAIIVDSLSQMFQAAMQNVLHNSGKRWQSADISKLKSFIEIQHWGLAFQDIINVMQILKSLPCVVVVIAHDQRDTIGKDTNAMEIIELGISGKNMPGLIPSYFDEFWYMKARQAGAGKLQRIIQTQSNNTTSSRTRLQVPDSFDVTDVSLVDLLLQFGYNFPSLNPTAGLVVSSTPVIA
jgi:hypothetical protein